MILGIPGLASHVTAHALQNEELAAARRLLDLGARADAPVGEEDMPVALLPVVQIGIEAVRMLKGGDAAGSHFPDGR
jgi:hypothetical protein